MLHTRRVQRLHQRQPEQHPQPEQARPEFQPGIDPQRMRAAPESVRDSRMLPRHIPPINVPNSTASDAADDPITSCNSCSQTTS